MKAAVFCLFAAVAVLAVTYANADGCTPGETKQEDCNTCTCTKSNIFVCTKKRCIGKRDADECTPGETKQEDCNTCTCTSSKVYACTKRLCLGKREAIAAGRSKRDDHIEEDLKTTPCVRGDYFKVKCNTCYCGPNGHGYLCTDNNCNGDGFAEPYSTTYLPYGEGHTVVISSTGVKVADRDAVLYNLNVNTYKNENSDVASRTPDSNTLDNALVSSGGDNLGVGDVEPLEEECSASSSATTAATTTKF